MNMPRTVVIGSGHLGLQIKRKLDSHGIEANRIFTREDNAHEDAEHSTFEIYQRAMRNGGVPEAEIIFIVDAEDRLNISYFLAAVGLNPRARIIISLFNETLAPHLAAQENVTVLNPAVLAANAFADVLGETGHTDNPHAEVPPLPRTPAEKRAWPVRLFLILIAVIALATAFFHINEGLSWLDAVYFTVTIITTTGFGDITLLHSPPIAKVVGIVLMFFGISLISIIFSLLVDQLIRRREDIRLGKKRYRLSGHIIVCGLGRVGYQVAHELRTRGHEVIVIERNPSNRYIESARLTGAHTLIADAFFSRTLTYARIDSARAVMSVIQDDLVNLEIGLTARAARPDVRIIIRMFDTDIAHEVKQRLNVHHALSTSEIAAREFVAAALKVS